MASAKDLGKTLAGLSNQQTQTKDNVSPDDVSAQLNAQFSELARVTGVFTATQYLYPTDSFIIDHPIYGNIDSAVLLIDGGYDTGNPDNGDVIYTESF